MKATLKGNFKTREIWLDGKKLNPGPSQKIWNHSPDGFSWGYGGSGPAQLALAIMLKFYEKDIAVRNHQDFKETHIATLPQSDFDIIIDF